MKERFILDRILVSLYREVMRQSIDFRLALCAEDDGIRRDYIYSSPKGWVLSCVTIDFTEPTRIAFANKIYSLGIK